MAEDSVRNEVSQLGKYHLISRLTEGADLQNSTSVVGVGDDAAVIDNDRDETVVAHKLFLEHVHFDLMYFPLKHLGYKCTGIAITDVLAMNAIPQQVSVSLAISNRFSVEAVEELTEGIRACCHNYHLDLVGLDITSSRIGLAISVTAIGAAPEAQIVKRDGAKENELICVSGDFGAAYAGLLLLEREKAVFEASQEAKPQFEGYEYLLERQLKPEPRIDIVKALQEKDVLPTSMIAVGDGLASSLFHICEATGLGCIVYENKTPIDQLTFDTLRSMKIVATTAAYNGGEDYELLFTIRQSDYEKIQEIENVSVIGYLTEKGGGRYLISNDNVQVELQAQDFIRREAE